MKQGGCKMNTYQVIKPQELTENTFQLIGSDWMLVTAQNNDKVNTMTASWGGFGIMWGKPVAYVVIRPQRYTREFVDAADGFTLTFFPDGYKKELGYLGKVSGRDEDKISKAGLTVVSNDGYPYFEEGNLVLKVKKLFRQRYTEDSFIDQSIIDKMYPEKDFHYLYICEIEEILKKAL